jgi:4a-hydroxytetrahydrobiopterin dehydratase
MDRLPEIRQHKQTENAIVLYASQPIGGDLMSDFAGMTCEACRVGAPPATPEQIEQFLEDCPDWEMITVDEVPQIRRVYGFDDFATALEFTNKVGALAEQEGHHPALLTEWGRVTVRWWTHKIRGLHLNDLVMGAKTDRIYGGDIS